MHMFWLHYIGGLVCILSAGYEEIIKKDTLKAIYYLLLAILIAILRYC